MPPSLMTHKSLVSGWSWVAIKELRLWTQLVRATPPRQVAGLALASAPGVPSRPEPPGAREQAQEPTSGTAKLRGYTMLRELSDGFPGTICVTVPVLPLYLE